MHNDYILENLKDINETFRYLRLNNKDSTLSIDDTTEKNIEYQRKLGTQMWLDNKDKIVSFLV